MKTRIALAVICLTGKSMLFAQSTQEVILFDYDSYALNENASDQLDLFIQKLDVENIKKIEIIGHTDSDGSLVYNQELSRNRAETVQQKFNALALDQKKFEINFQGEEKPVASNLDDMGKQSNRRVEILVEYFDFQIPESFIGKKVIFNIDPKADTSLIIGERGTMLFIPKDAFIDANGNLVQSEVKLSFSEYTNSAEIAFSGIPMTYKRNNEEWNFNSAGMFEITGSSEGKRIEIAENKKLRIDYSLIQKPDNIDFYQLKENGKWNIIQNINKEKPNSMIPDFNITSEVSMKIKKRKGERWIFTRKINKKDKFIGWKPHMPFKDDGNREDATLLGDGTSNDAGHTYPDIVKGLNVESFGVYNCDQIYRLENQTNVLADYVDDKGNKINGPKILSLIDLNYNGAFSFDPKSFICNSKANNVLALFTNSGKLYLTEKGQLQEMDLKNNHNYTIIMKDVSDEIKSSEDLAQYLGIKI
ncbi:MAG: OmpA family protein [Crocinitomicaceae bacterium]|nr:OmpA family protein [Crocinitomicaceae bacterium]